MIGRRTLTLGSLSIAGSFIGAGVKAGGCPVPDTFAIQASDIPATTAAIAKNNLTILALGGAATLAFPKVTISVAVRAVARETDAALLAELESSLASIKPSLVIWGPGGSAAARGDDLDTFLGTVNDIIGKVRAAGADLILMTLQYAPSVSRLVNLAPYRTAVLRAGEDAGIPVLDRYELMRFWSDNDFLNLDVTNANDRIHVSRVLYDCMAEILADAIVDVAK
jgi:hypothetical protein